MVFETALRRFSLLPSLAQTGNGDSSRAHFVGKDKATPLGQKQDSGGRNDNDPKQTQTGKYRELATISLGEVDDVHRYFRSQLFASPNEAWIAKNYFCTLPLKRKGDGRPSAVFGRVKTCYPGEGHVQNVEELEMYFPRKDGTPDVLHLYMDDIALQRPVQSYCVGVKCFVSPQEKDDFIRSENIFAEKGFLPAYETGYIELMDVTEQNHSALPWLYVIGSEWFASVDESVQGEIREKLRNLVYWDKAVLNYHPRRYSLRYRSLNDELDFNYGFSERVLVAPQDTGQALMKVEERFGEMFMRGM